MSFLHGIEYIESQNGIRPIKVVRSSVIGLVGTAPDADPIKFPLNQPVLISGSPADAAKLDSTGNGSGTLPSAINGIFDNAGALVVVVRVEEDEPSARISNIIGGVDSATEKRTGIHALLSAQSAVGVTPKILIAPNFSGYVTRNGDNLIEGAPVATELDIVASKLNAISIIEGPNTTHADAVAFKGIFSSRRVFIVDPAILVWDTNANATAVEGNSARAAGVMVLNDHERGVHTSPSNREIKGIVGTARPIDFAMDDANSRANLLNENNIATIISDDGFKLWGSRTCSSDPKWQFIQHVRLEDMIKVALFQSHKWAVDRNITKNYIEEVSEGVNRFFGKLKNDGVVSGGECWADLEANTETSMDAGQVIFNFDYGRYGLSERITFRAAINNDYTVEEVFAS
ncbi:phage tail sheath C-terminal domain-containing protein [Pseudomonas sp. HK3]